MKKTIFFLLFWFLLVNFFALLVANRFNLRGDTAYGWIDPKNTPQEHTWNPVALHARWDSFWYQDIAEKGYYLQRNNTLSNVVFFPVYPLLMRVAAPVVGGDVILAGWLLSALALVGAVVVFYKLIREFHPEIDPETAIFYLLIFPTAFFLNAVYTESLFLFLSLLTFYYARKGKFAAAGAIGMLAALTRITGVLLFIPVAWEYFKRHGYRIPWPAFLIPLGTFLFFIYHYFAFGDPLLFFRVESAWGRAFQFNREHFLLFSHPAAVNFFLDIAFSAFAIFSAYHVFRRGWTSYGLYILATLAVALSSGTFMSIGRYIMVLFPIYIALASIKSRHFEKIYTVASILLLALNITLFVNWYWAG